MIHIEVDKGTIIGRNHAKEVGCSEDYADYRMLAEDKVILALSDGCSSGQKSDLASRAWVSAALSVGIQDSKTLYQERQKYFPTAKFSEDMATLSVAEINSADKRVRLHIIGDGGALLIRDSDEGRSFTLYMIRYSHNMPFYPVYATQSKLQETWARDSQNAEKTLDICTWTEGSKEDPCIQSIKLNLQDTYVAEFSMESFSGILLMSDGVASLSKYADLRSETLSAVAGVKDICQFKQMAGRFITRRLARQLQTWTNDGNLPADDLTVVGAYWTVQTETN